MSGKDVKRVCVVGLGYIGLPTAAMFASRQVDVIGVDINPETVDTINQGKVHIVEPDLDIVVRAVVADGKLRATTMPEEADAFIIAVPTPFKGDTRSPDLSYIEAACNSVSPVLRPGNLIVLESTSPVGTTESISHWLAELRPDLSFPHQVGSDSDVRIAHCPERVLPGQVMHELVHNDRVVGGMTVACAERAVSLYRTFVSAECVVASSTRVAEMAKLSENAFRDVNIAFANELSMICDELEIDVWELISITNRHPRVGILRPGPGVGGHCIAVDPWFIVASSPDSSPLISAAREVNDNKPHWVLGKVSEKIGKIGADRRAYGEGPISVAIYGLAFKPNIDDLRESPALEIAQKIAGFEDVAIVIAEPNIDYLPSSLSVCELVPNGEYSKIDADLHIFLVAHDEFRGLEPIHGVVIDVVKRDGH